MKFTEAQLESAIIKLLGVEGYPHVLGGAIERQPQEVLIKADLRACLAKQYAADHITPQEIEAVIKQLEAYSPADLYESNKAIMKLVSDGFHLKRERILTPSPSPKGRGESGNEGSFPLGGRRDEGRSQRALAELFAVGVPAINKHLKNIFESGELNEKGTISKMETVRQEGRRTVDFPVAIH